MFNRTPFNSLIPFKLGLVRLDSCGVNAQPFGFQKALISFHGSRSVGLIPGSAPFARRNDDAPGAAGSIHGGDDEGA